MAVTAAEKVSFVIVTSQVVLGFSVFLFMEEIKLNGWLKSPPHCRNSRVWNGMRLGLEKQARFGKGKLAILNGIFCVYEYTQDYDYQTTKYRGEKNSISSTNGYRRLAQILFVGSDRHLFFLGVCIDLSE